MKRRKIDDYLYSISANYILLRKLDPKEAMAYALYCSDRDVIEQLRKDEIWDYWFRRDIPPVGETPTGKRNYLWCRLLIGALQWSLLRKWGQQDQYIRLNVIAPNLDFRTEFTRRTGLPYNIKNLYKLEVDDPFDNIALFRRFINARYRTAYNFNYVYIDQMNTILHNILDHLLTGKHFHPEEEYPMINGRVVVA